MVAGECVNRFVYRVLINTNAKNFGRNFDAHASAFGLFPLRKSESRKLTRTLPKHSKEM
jgi:hypothetical protein